jgi:hypothetical protein
MLSSKSRDSSLCIATGYGLDGRDSIPGRGKRLFFAASRPAVEITQPPILWTPRVSFLGVKRLGHGADHSPSSAEVKNGRAIPPLPHMS